MKIAITGSSGFVGSALVRHLETSGHRVIRLIRGDSFARTSVLSSDTGTKCIFWDPENGYIDANAIDDVGIDAVVNLAGENVHQRWTTPNRNRIVKSRIRSTELLRNAILQLKKRPRVLVSASGISYYHNLAVPASQGLGGLEHSKDGAESTVLDESSERGSGFLSDVCHEWERASEMSVNEVRTVNLRIGIVLGTTGGVLKKLLPIFKLGLGGKWGTGKQYMSWVAIDDIVRMIYFAISNDSISGPVNAVAPTPVTNLEFARTLSAVLSRPSLFSIPGWLAGLMYGTEWAKSTLLADYRIRPSVLLENRFHFLYPELEPFLNEVLAHKAS